MKIMNQMVLIISFFFLNSSSIKAGLILENGPYDIIPLYKRGNSLITKDINLYGTINVEGSPNGVINKEFLSFGDKKIIFKDYENCLLKKCIYKNDVKLLFFDGDYVSLKIESYDNGIASTTFENQKIYFKIGYNNFSYDSKWNNAQWRVYQLPSNIKDLAKHVDVESLRPFFDNVRTCISKKSIDCLKSLYEKDQIQNRDLLDRNIRARAMLEDKKLCAEFEDDQSSKDWQGVFPEKIIRKANVNNNVFWDELSKSIRLDLKYATYEVKKRDFNNVIVIKIENPIMPSKTICYNEKNLTFQIVFIGGEWKIQNISTYEFRI